MSTVDKAIETVTTHVNNLAVAADPYIPQTAKDAAAQLASTVTSHGETAVAYATSVKDTLVAKAGELQTQARDLTAQVLFFSNTTLLSILILDDVLNVQASAEATKYTSWAYTSATTTITAYTPGPVLTFVNDTVARVEAAAHDPSAAIKEYVPAYVIHTSERTLEIVTEGFEQTVDKVNQTTGFIVSRVNGSVEYVKAIPQVHSVIDQLNAITKPVIEKIKAGAHISAKEAEAETAAAAP
ncbi:hypothetical protein HK100_005679 [Physocladia obscura]|uniref:Uncharacterized protein n=1 Tax=Physocladia obscura TaxID=109957 RepID=A0AAD5SRE3_9FUNG|nr:hypothetical protein HK100_005679 [Physocladia obscura]